MFGPPGTGKTLMARAVAGEAGVPFFSISGLRSPASSSGSASSASSSFRKARKRGGVIFIDEIDASAAGADATSRTMKTTAR